MKKSYFIAVFLFFMVIFLYPDKKVVALKLLGEGEEIIVNIELENNEIDAYAGQSGKLRLAKYKGFQPEGVFQPFKNEKFELKKDGSWKSYGEFHFNWSITVSYTENSLKKLQELTPRYVVINPKQEESLRVDIKYRNKAHAVISELQLMLKRDIRFLKEIYGQFSNSLG